MPDILTKAILIPLLMTCHEKQDLDEKLTNAERQETYTLCFIKGFMPYLTSHEITKNSSFNAKMYILTYFIKSAP